MEEDTIGDLVPVGEGASKIQEQIAQPVSVESTLRKAEVGGAQTPTRCPMYGHAAADSRVGPDMATATKAGSNA